MSNSPVEVLQARLAAGEISVSQYKEIIAALNEGGGAAAQSTAISSAGSTVGQFAGTAYDALFGQDTFDDPTDSAPLEVSGNFSLYGTFLEYKGTRHPLTDVLSVGYTGMSGSVAGIPNGTSSMLSLRMVGGQDFNISSNSLIFTGAKNKRIGAAYKFISNRTQHARFNRYLADLNEKGYCETSGVQITRDGFVIKGSKRVNLTVAAENKTLLFGTHWGAGFNSSDNPYTVVAGETGTGVFSGRIKFQVLYDRDVIFSILYQLAGMNN